MAEESTFKTMFRTGFTYCTEGVFTHIRIDPAQDEICVTLCDEKFMTEAVLRKDEHGNFHCLPFCPDCERLMREVEEQNKKL